MKDRNIQIDLLADFVEVEVSIMCGQCREGTYLSEFNPERDAYKEGWRVSADGCDAYCPKCAKKFLKKSKPHASAQKSK